MSYARFGEDGSDVYVYATVLGGYECCGCRIEESSFHCQWADEMIDHLREHERAGHTVPFDALERLAADAVDGAAA